MGNDSEIFRAGKRVRLKSAPDRTGILTGEKMSRAGRVRRQVDFNPGKEFKLESEIELIDVESIESLLEKNMYGRLHNMRSLLTHARLTDGGYINEPALAEQVEKLLNRSDYVSIPDDFGKYFVTPVKTQFPIERNIGEQINNMLWTNIIDKCRKRKDPNSPQWERLPFLAIGGGRSWGKYGAFAANINDNLSIHVGLEEISISKPESLDAPNLPDREFFRFCVSFGLSFDDLGKHIPTGEIGDIERSIATMSDSVSKDFC